MDRKLNCYKHLRPLRIPCGPTVTVGIAACPAGAGLVKENRRVVKEDWINLCHQVSVIVRYHYKNKVTAESKSL